MKANLKDRKRGRSPRNSEWGGQAIKDQIQPSGCWVSGCGLVLTQDAVLQLSIGAHIWVRGPEHSKGLGVLTLRHLQGEVGSPKGWCVVILILHSHSYSDMS